MLSLHSYMYHLRTCGGARRLRPVTVREAGGGARAAGGGVLRVAAWKVEMERYATVKAVREVAVVAQGATTMAAELVQGATSANTQGAAGGGTTSE